MCRRPLKLLLVVGCLAAPRMVAAQSAIAGVARDATGAVLPGVTIEVSSPALIEKTRATSTDQAGQYRVVDLRPGTYSVIFTLAGFSTVKREGIVLEANFTAPVNAELRVGALAETVTVSGETPVVDVQNTTRREVVNRELLDTLPTGRDFQTIGNTLPGVTMGRFDVAGSSTAQSGTLVAFARRGLPAQDRRHARQQQLRRGLVQRDLPQRGGVRGDVVHGVRWKRREPSGRCLGEYDPTDRRQQVRVRVPGDVRDQQVPEPEHR